MNRDCSPHKFMCHAACIIFFSFRVVEVGNSFFIFLVQDDSKGDKSIISLSLRSKLKQLRFIGRMIGFAVYQNLLLNLQLSKPFVKQV